MHVDMRLLFVLSKDLRLTFDTFARNIAKGDLVKSTVKAY